MTVRAVFELDNIKFEEVYPSRKKFLNVIHRTKRATFLHAIDIERGIVIYPSTLPAYKQMA